MGMGAGDDLLIRGFDPLDKLRVRCSGDFAVAGETAKVVHSLKDDEPAHSGLRQHVAIEARERVRPQAVDQQVVSADSLIQDADVARRRLKPCSRWASTSVQRSLPLVVEAWPSVMESPSATMEAAPGAVQHVNAGNLEPVVHGFCARADSAMQT